MRGHIYDELEKCLNLVHGSPSFCLRALPNGSMDVIQPAVIPNDEHDYWVHAELTLACGQPAQAVFCIGSGGAEHHAIKVRVGNAWFDSGDPKLPGALGLTRGQVFPFDWKYSIPVANDIYHKES